MYDHILKKNKKEDQWRFLIISGTCVFFFICILLIILDNTLGIFDLDENETSNCSAKKSKSLWKTRQIKDSQKCTVLNSYQYCQVQCKEMTTQEIVENSHVITCDTNDVHLILENIQYNNGNVEKNWLEGFVQNVIILELKGSLLNNIGDSSFGDSPFYKLSRLVLENTNVGYFRKRIFEGSNITDLEFRSDTFTKINFEFGVLNPLSNTLNSIQLSRCILEPQVLVNLTGTNTTLKFLNLIDLRFNSILSIKDYSFIDLPNVIQIYLTDSSITNMEKNAFTGIGTVMKSLLISNNKLQTLPEGIFDPIVSSHTTGIINITGNEWLCNCDLLWLKHFYEKEIANYFGNGTIEFHCKTDKGEKNYKEVEFCPSTTSTSNITITPLEYNTTTTNITTNLSTANSTIITTSKPNITITSSKYNLTTTTGVTPSTVTKTTLSPSGDEINIICRDCSNRRPFKAKNSRVYSYTTSVRNGTITYDFYEIDGTPFYEVKLRNSIHTDYMIWFNAKDSNEVGCEYNIQEIVILSRLAYNKNYVICLLKQNETTVSPFDCTALLTKSEWKDKPWIINKNKSPIIILYVIIVLIITALTIAGTYCTIRRHPKLIGIVKQPAFTDKHFIKEQYESTAPSMYSSSDGYLSPKYYERTLVKRRCRKLSTISERDCEGAFYNASVSHLYEPPPLPPNHPKVWRKVNKKDKLHPRSIPLRRCNSYQIERFCLSPMSGYFRSKSLPSDTIFFEHE